MVIRIDEETTLLTQPVAANGYVDFTDEWNQRLRRGVDSSAEPNLIAVATAGTQFELSVETSVQQIRMEELIAAIREQSGVIQLPPMSGGAILLDRKWSVWHQSDGRDRWLHRLTNAMSDWTLDAIKSRNAKHSVDRLDAMADVLNYLCRSPPDDNRAQPLLDETAKMLLTATAVNAVSREDVREIVRRLPDITEADLVNEIQLLRMRRLTFRFAEHAGETVWLNDRPNAPLWVRIYMMAENRRTLANLDWNQLLAQTNRLHDNAARDVSRFAKGEIPMSEFRWLRRPDSPQFHPAGLGGRSTVADRCGVDVAWRIYRDHCELCYLIGGWCDHQRLLTFLKCTMILNDCAEDGSFPSDLDQLRLDSSGQGSVFLPCLEYECSGDFVELRLHPSAGSAGNLSWICNWERSQANGPWDFTALHGWVPRHQQ